MCEACPVLAFSHWPRRHQEVDAVYNRCMSHLHQRCCRTLSPLLTSPRQGPLQPLPLRDTHSLQTDPSTSHHQSASIERQPQITTVDRACDPIHPSECSSPNGEPEAAKPSGSAALQAGSTRQTQERSLRRAQSVEMEAAPSCSRCG